MKEIKYHEKISNCGVYIQGIGRMHSPFLKDVFSYGLDKYQEFLGLMICSPKEYFSKISKETKSKNLWDDFTNDQKNNMTMFDILICNDALIDDMVEVFSLFIFGDLVWDKSSKSILINKEIIGKKSYVDGVIDKNNFLKVLDLCLQFADIDKKGFDPEPLKFNTEKDREFYEKFMEKKRRNQKNNNKNKNLDMENIISVVCVYHNSINYCNVFDITICQLHDMFSRMAIERQIAIQQNNYSVWGGKFDHNKWFEHL